MISWEDIHFCFFDEGYQRLWEEKGLTYQDAQEWIPIGFEPYSYDKVKNWKEQNFNSSTARVWIQAGFSLSEAEKAKQWQNQDFTPDWIKAGLNSHELDFAIYLKQNNYQPTQLTTNKLLELRKEFYPGYPQAQGYLDKNYPCNCDKNKRDYHGIIHQENCPRKNLEELNLRNLNLEGNLDLDGFPICLKIYSSGNPNLGKIKNKPSYATLIYQNPQEWLPNKEQIKEISVHKRDRLYIVEDEEIVLSEYPNLEEVEIDGKYLDMGKILQSGLTKLEVSACPKLTRLFCYRNDKLTSFTSNCPNLQEIDCSDNQLTQIKLPQGEKLETLSLLNNKFDQDLSFLSEAVNLEELYLSNNKFYGSLEPLKEMSKLKSLNISDTDINSGLEYLPENVETFWCSADGRPEAKCWAIYNLFADEKGEVETEYGRIKNFPQKFQAWRQANPDLINNVQQITELEQILHNFNLALINGKVENETTSEALDIFQFETENRIIEMRKQNQAYYQAQVVHNPLKTN